MNSIASFLIWMSAADPVTLAKVPRTERAKFIGMGGLVLTTAFMAAFGCLVTLHDVLGLSWLGALVGAVVWGTIILNLDRFVVASMRRQPNRWVTFGLFLPRFALTVLLAFVIAEPILLRVVAPSIEAEIPLLERQRNAAFERALDADPRYSAIVSNERRIAQLRGVLDGGDAGRNILRDPVVRRLEAEVARREQIFDGYAQAVVCEKEGKCGSGRVGAGPAYREKIENRDRADRELSEARRELDDRKAEVSAAFASSLGRRRGHAAPELAELERRTTKLAAERETRVLDARRTNGADLGVLMRIKALGKLADSDPTVNIVLWFMRLIAIAIDLVAVVGKLLMCVGAKSPYEEGLEEKEKDAVEAIGEEARARSTARRIRASLVVDESRLAHDESLAATADVARYAAEREAELGKRAIDHWYARQAALMAADPDAFLDQVQ